ncbi:UNVERIFIED_CONTAM: Caffeoylshikimate esterase [Sesamum latifolium]|uniref:Caffeoylshikimate esterase n=1 Tax=Sesamum latifolium TaxID=2727402 RepID=A0AAW2WN18_9LAMI
MEEEKRQNQGLTHYWGNTPEEEYYKEQGIKSTNSYYTSPRGLALFTKSWQPLQSSPPRGIICMVHGYGNDISWTFQGTAIFLAQNGFACFALDLEGHGRSRGLKAYVPNVDLVVDDCISFFNCILTQDPNFQNLPRFLFGESMGGAICLLIHFKQPEFFRGAILIAPMCRISDKVRPKWPIPQILTAVAGIAPTLPIVPTADLLEKSVKVPEKKIISVMNPMRYQGKPRLGTVLELLRVTDYVSSKLSDVSIPFIVIHGSADVVTDPAVSRELYQVAKSEDKSIKIYEGMMHSLLFGETDENVAIVRGDILKWLNDRCSFKNVEIAI